ncbi:MAG: phosphate signaling complex protein PhoU [Pseudomonadota bacterium]
MVILDQTVFRTFDEELDQIDSAVLQMGGIVETQIRDAVECLLTRDDELSEDVRERDLDVDELELEIDAAVVQVIAQREPKARDLRMLLSIMKISSNLERIGDYAKNTAKRSSVIGEFRHIGASADVLRRMSLLVQGMLKDVLDAQLKRDVALADEVRSRDVQVDSMHNTLFRELLTYMMEDPRSITPCMHLLFIAKNLERMGDHVTGIAEQVHFRDEGELPEAPRPKKDVTNVPIDVPDTGNGAVS